MDLRETLAPRAVPRGRPRRPLRRADVVVDHVRAELAAGRIAAGDRLPTEHELAERLGVGRNSVREAVRTLQSAGLVDVRHGTGTFVREGVEASLAQLMLFRTLVAQAEHGALIEVRAVFERACAELAARRRGEADLAAMRDAIDRMRRLATEDAPSADAMLAADLAFHRAVYRAGGNEMLASLADFVLTAVSPWIGRSLAHHGPARTAAIHETEYRRIVAGDVDGAGDDASAALRAADLNMELWREGLAGRACPPRFPNDPPRRRDR